MNGPDEAVDVFRRFWSPEESSAPASTGRLRQTVTLFDVRQDTVFLPEHGGPFSLKMVLSGESRYAFGRRSFAVTPGQVLVVAPGDRYATSVPASAHIVTAYLPERWVAAAARTLCGPDEEMLDDPGACSTEAVDFAAHIRRDGESLGPLVQRLASLEDALAREEALTRLASGAAAFALEARRSIRRTGARRRSTRAELFRRISRARALIEADPSARLSLEALAAAAALSPFHLLRIFGRAFGETPAGMRRRLRIERAKQLLAASDLPVHEVSGAAGFESHAGFCRAFRHATGLSPTQFRQASA
ncbi:MAG TPA: AraC family transcriptional regulator [Allosphingosinicella sp.]